MPDVTVAAIVVNALHDVFDRVDLVGAHHEQLLLVGDEHHVSADHMAEGAFGQEGLGKVVEVGNRVVLPVGILVDGEEVFLGVEREMAAVVVDEVVGVRPVADDEQLHEGQQRVGEAVAGVLFIIDDLLHGPARADLERLELDLGAGDAVDEKDHVVAVEAAAGVDSELTDDLVVVFAPVLDVDQSEVKRGAVVALEGIDAS